MGRNRDDEAREARPRLERLVTQEIQGGGVGRLERLAEKGEARARALGLREEDVQRLVDEVRRENRERGN